MKNGEIEFSSFSEYNKKLKHLKLVENKYHRKYLKENKYNHKKKWSYINKLLGRYANACEYDITINNVQVTDLNDVGNHFNTFTRRSRITWLIYSW